MHGDGFGLDCLGFRDLVLSQTMRYLATDDFGLDPPMHRAGKIIITQQDICVIYGESPKGYVTFFDGEKNDKERKS